VDSNNKVSVIGIGLVSFRARVLKRYLNIVLNNILYFSYLEASLISMELLQKTEISYKIVVVEFLL